MVLCIFVITARDSLTHISANYAFTSTEIRVEFQTRIPRELDQNLGPTIAFLGTFIKGTTMSHRIYRLIRQIHKYTVCQGIRYEQTFETSLAWAKTR